MTPAFIAIFRLGVLSARGLRRTQVYCGNTIIIVICGLVDLRYEALNIPVVTVVRLLIKSKSWPRHRSYRERSSKLTIAKFYRTTV